MQAHDFTEQDNTIEEESNAAPSTSWLDNRTLPGALAVDQIYDPNLPHAEDWDCIEAIVEQLQMEGPLSPEFRLRIANQLSSITCERVMRADRFRLLHWALEEQDAQTRRTENGNAAGEE
jgi:hypothetical protein